MSDEDVEAVRRVQAGESDAFELLVEKYKRKAFRLAFGVLRDQEEALDVAQEAFVKAFHSLPKFRGGSAFYTWFFRITMNLALDRKRQRTTRTKAFGVEDVPPDEVERTAVSPERGPEDEAAGVERRARIARALESLSEHHRAIIILSDIEGLSYREIAEVLAIPMGTVMSRLHNARRRLRETLGPGFLSVLLAVALIAGLGVPVLAQTLTPTPSPLGPPLGSPPTPTPMPGGPHVCVYALILLASNEAGARPGPPPFQPRRLPAPPPPSVAPVPEPDEWSTQGVGCGRPGRLGPWVPRLREVFGFSTFEPMSAFETIMPLGMVQRFALPGGRELEILPLAIRQPVVRIAIKIVRGPVTEIATVMDVPPRRPALIGGPPHGPGVLIIAIRSRPEP